MHINNINNLNINYLCHKEFFKTKNNKNLFKINNVSTKIK